MKVTILSESPADESAARVLLEALLGRAVQLMPPARFRAGGWGSIPGVVAVELKHLHYRTDSDALVVWADSDDSVPHASHAPDATEHKCRFCQLTQIIEQTHASLTPVQGRPLIKTAVALAVPAAEAWYRCGIDVHATELHFVRLFQQGQRLTQIRRQLKREVYRTDVPPRQLELSRALEEAQRLAQDLTRLRRDFPGFDLFAKQVRAW